MSPLAIADVRELKGLNTACSTNPTKKQIEMSFRKSDAVKRTKKADEPVITFEGLTEGQVVKGVVKRIESYGAFIRIKGSTVSGLCHKSQVSHSACCPFPGHLVWSITYRHV